MITATFGIAAEPFHRREPNLLEQQQKLLSIIKIHAQHGGFSVIVGDPGNGKTVLREHIEQLGQQREITVVSCCRTLHSYLNILRQLAESFRLDVPDKTLESELIKSAFNHIRHRKTLYILIDDAHLLDMLVLRKLRLLLGEFPKNHNLILFGQYDLLHTLTLNVNFDIKSRITFSGKLLPLSDTAIEQYIIQELEAVKLGINTYDEAAIELIIRSVQGNLRLCRHLCYNSLLEACRDNKRIVTITHVNNILVQPHWRSHEELVKQQRNK